MSKHTPGPWVVLERGFDLVGNSDIRISIKTEEDEPWTICKLSLGCDAHHENSFGEDRANARLIAAAPDLYAALQASQQLLLRIHRGENWGAIEEYMDDNTAAIAKAEGKEKAL